MSAKRKAGLGPGRPRASSRRVGVWLVGAHGGLATTVIAGARLIARRYAGTTGLVTETDALQGLDLPDVSDFVFGGHDIRSSSVFGSALEVDGEAGTLGIDRLRAIKADLDAELRLLLDRYLAP